jgi:hypothetical protein
MTAVPSQSMLLLTLDSCRYDTFVAARLPNLKALGPVHRARAPSYFTYASHAAMFVGFTPGIAEVRQPFLNPKYGKIFKLGSAAFSGKGREHIVLEGRSIIDGYKRKGFLAVGSGAAAWFDPATDTGRLLSQDFDAFYYPGNTWSAGKQVAWLLEQIASTGRPVLVFLNCGETHVPYYHEGATWDRNHNPCIPFASTNDAGECRRRQRLCLEFCDQALAPLLAAFADASVVACADHGDCWGEDGLWEHGVHHDKVLEVPLLFRLRVDGH